MTVIQYAPIALSIASIVAAARSAWLWRKASKVDYRPFWETDEGKIMPVDGTQAALADLAALQLTVRGSGQLNAVAAKWTGWAVAVGAAAMFVDHLIK